MFDLTSVDLKMFEMIREPVGIYLMLGCVFMLFMQHMMKKSYRGDALFLVQYYRKNLGLSFLLVFLYPGILFSFIFKYLFSFWKKSIKGVFLDNAVAWCTWLAKDK